MKDISTSAFSAAAPLQCAVLTEIVGSIAHAAVACLDLDGSRAVVTSGPCPSSDCLPDAIEQCSGQLTSVESVTPDVVDSTALGDLAGDGAWRVFHCGFSCGTSDRVALLSSEDEAVIVDFLTKFWSGIRRMCVSKTQEAISHLSDDAMLWMISRKMNAAVLVLDHQCRVLKANAAGRETLAQNDLLRNTPRGLMLAQNRESRALRVAVDKLLQEQSPDRTEYVLFVRRPGQDERVPMTLSLYQPKDGGQPLIMVMLPRPPEQKRIEDLARQMGLTPSEARVAALIRSGLSNREAAERAGLKVETFNTYSKRVLSKMNVSCRAEMAQMLTWQASMERSL